MYDPVHRIAMYDEGCCTWHHVVVASNVPPPPKTIVARSLVGLHTKRGIRLGHPPSAVEAIYGPAPKRSVSGSGHAMTLSYFRTQQFVGIVQPGDASMTFVFTRNRLTAMDFLVGC